jgi:hypothetical protein
VDDQILVRVNDPMKMEERNIGPFPTTCVHINGLVTIGLCAHVLQQINVLCIKPYPSWNLYSIFIISYLLEGG